MPEHEVIKRVIFKHGILIVYQALQLVAQLDIDRAYQKCRWNNQEEVADAIAHLYF